MKRRLLRRPDVVCLCILATILAISPLAGAQSKDGRIVEKPTLVADKISYLPGETILFSGGSWKPGEGVTIVIKSDSAGIIATIQGAADENGILNISATMPKLASSGSANTAGKNTPILTATAVGSSGTSVSTQFTPGHAPTDAERLISEEEFWNHRLTYPTGRYSPAWTRKAAEADLAIPRGVPAGRKAVHRNGVEAMDPSAFTPLGPMPEHMTGCNGCYDYGFTEGRVNAIVTDPTTTTNGSIVAYMGSVGGGVWKTTNCCTANTTWTVMTDSPLLSTTSIDTLALDPNDHNTIYAGTGDLNYGSFSMGSQGIFKSTDGGNTWTVLGADVFGPEYIEPAGNYPQYDSVGKVRVDPNNSSNIVAGTKKGLWFSYDQGATWTNCVTNSFVGQRQDITGLELTDMGGGVTRILAAVGVRGFPTYVQYDLGLNGANGLYKGTMPVSGCPTDFTSIASNSNGFVFGTQVTGSPYLTGAKMNAGSGNACNYPISGGNATYCGNGATGGTTTDGGTVNNLGRLDIGVAPSDPNTIYVQAQAIDWDNNSNCGNTSGCQIGAWASNDGGATWTFMAGSQGGALPACASSGPGSGSPGSADYPQNWYDQGIVVDPNNPDRVFFDTFEVFLASRTGTAWYDLTCGYNGSSVSNHVVHVDQHALAFVNGSSDILLAGNDGGVHATTNASTASLNTARPTWFNLDGGINAIEFYSGDISGNFASSANPSAVGGAQDNGPSSVMFSGSPTGAAQWQMGLGGDGFSGLIDPMGTGSTQAQGTITLTTGGAMAGQQFQIGPQVFTFVTSGSGTGQVVLSSSTTTEGNNIVTAITRDLPTLVTAARSGATVVVTAVMGGSSGNSIIFNNINAANFSMNGGGFLGGTTQGDDTGSLRYWEGNNSGGFSRCIHNCTQPGATWSSWRGSWTGDTQSFVLPVHLFHGGIAGGDDCPVAGTTSGCGHLLAGTTRVWETVQGTASTFSSGQWYVTNNPITANLTKGTLGNRSYINQVKYSPKYQSVAIAGTNDGNVQIGFGLGSGTQAQATWVNVTGGNAVLPNRPIMGIALAPDSAAPGTPTGYAAVGGFNNNSPSTPGHVFRVVCTMTSTPCDGFTWTDKTGNLPDIPVDSIIVNPNFPSQVFAGTDFGLYYTDDVTANPPVWTRFNNGLPNVMIWDMSVDRGATTLALWTRSRGAYAWPLPLGPENPLPTSTSAASASGTYGGTASLSAVLTSGGNPVSGKTINFSLNGNPVGSGTTDNTGTATLPNASLAGINAGSYPTGVQSSFAGDSTYAASSGNGSLNVGLATLTVTADNKTMPDGGPVPPLTASYSGFVNGDNQSVLSGSPSLSTTANDDSPPGNYPITVTQGTLMAQNYTFAFVNGTMTVMNPVTAVITTPTKGSTFAGSSVTFAWTYETRATSYQIWLGHTPGAHDIGVVSSTGLSATMNNIPTDGSTVYATLYGYAGSWTVQDSATYTAATITKAQITSPAKGSTFTSSSVTFTWSAETGASSYQIWVGHSAGAHDIATVSSTGLTATVNGLPVDGSQIYVTLYGLAGSWTVQDSATYTAFTSTKAVITTPTKGSTLPGSKVTFGWTAETGATSYQIWVGNTPGAHDIAVASTTGLSVMVSGLPTDGRTLYVSLYGLAGSWTVQDTATYTAANVTKAAITTPPKGSTFTDTTVTFGWTAETGATSYQIWVGSTPGASDLAVRTTSALTSTISGLPNNSQAVYVTLYGLTDSWTVQDTANYIAFGPSR